MGMRARGLINFTRRSRGYWHARAIIRTIAAHTRGYINNVISASRELPFIVYVIYDYCIGENKR